MKIINAIEFANFSDAHLELWSMIKGANIDHSKYGAGKIIRVEQRHKYIPLIYVRFENDNLERTFNSDSFKLGVVKTIQVSDDLNSALKEWKNKFHNKKTQSNPPFPCPHDPRQSSLFASGTRAQQKTDTSAVNAFLSFGVKSLWHISHYDNMFSICQYGILSYYNAHKLNPSLFDISDPDVQRWRDRRDPHFNRAIHSYVPLYINHRNPMLYVRKNQQPDICIIEVDPGVIGNNDFLLTDGNAASAITKFFSDLSDLSELPWDVLNDKSWYGKKDGKRKMCAEVLIYPRVCPKYIKRIHCYHHDILPRLDGVNKPILITPKLYF